MTEGAAKIQLNVAVEDTKVRTSLYHQMAKELAVVPEKIPADFRATKSGYGGLARLTQPCGTTTCGVTVTAQNDVGREISATVAVGLFADKQKVGECEARMSLSDLNQSTAKGSCTVADPRLARVRPAERLSGYATAWPVPSALQS